MMNWILQVSLSGILISIIIYINMAYKEYKKFIYDNLEEIDYIKLCFFINKQYKNEQNKLCRKIYKEYIFLSILSKIICKVRYNILLNKENKKDIVEIKQEDIKLLDKDYKNDISNLDCYEECKGKTEKITDVIEYKYIEEISDILGYGKRDNGNINGLISKCLDKVKDRNDKNNNKNYGCCILCILYYALYYKYEEKIKEDYSLLDLTLDDFYYIVGYWNYKYNK